MFEVAHRNRKNLGSALRRLVIVGAIAGARRTAPSHENAALGTPAHGWSMFAGLAHPASRGRLRLQSADPLAPLAIDANMLSDPADMDTALACIGLCRELGNAPAFKPFVRREAMPGALGIGALRHYIRNAAVTYWHQTCTAKMGRDPMSVVDSSLKVYGVEGLRIADGSILPRVPTGNTQAPCAVIGERAAQMLKDANGLSNVERLHESASVTSSRGMPS